MNQSMSRVLLYGSAALAISGLAIAWATTSTDADVVTLLSSADSQLRLAHAMPAFDSNGNRLDSRDVMIVSAIEQLVKAERNEPGLAVTAEFRGFAHMLQGEFAAAAACYQEAGSRSDCSDEQRDILIFNQARMLVQADEPEQALALFAANEASLDARYGHQRRLEEARILSGLNSPTEAVVRLDIIRSDERASPMALLQAGRAYASLQYFEAAEDVLRRTRKELVIADYYLAQLKLSQGQTDISMELLERVSKARPIEVRRMLLDEANAWSAVSTDARFQKLSKMIPASPGR